MATYDGTDFRAIDSDAYADDRPMSTAIDHALRNNLAHLAKRGWQCSYFERLTSDGVPTPMYGGNASTLLGPMIVRVSPGCEGFRYTFAASSGPTTGTGLTNGAEVWLSVTSPQFGEIVGDRVDVVISTADDDYAEYEVSVTFTDVAAYDQDMAVHVMFRTYEYNVADADVDIGGNNIRAIEDPGSASFDRTQTARLYNFGADHIEILLDRGTYAHGAPVSPFTWEGGVVVDMTWIRHVGGQLEEVRDNRAIYDAWGIRAHDSVKGAKISPVAEAGKALSNYTLSEEVLGRWHVSSIGRPFEDGYTGGGYGEYSRWSGLSNQDTDFGPSAGRLPFVALTESPIVLVTLPVIAVVAEPEQVRGGFADNLSLYDVDAYESLTDGVEVRLEADISGFGSNTIDYLEFPVHRMLASGAWAFFGQMIPRHFDDTLTPNGGPFWTYREGQLFDFEGGVDERQLVVPLRVEVVSGGSTLTPGDLYTCTWEITYLQTMAAHIETLIVGQPVLHQYVTEEGI